MLMKGEGNELLCNELGGGGVSDMTTHSTLDIDNRTVSRYSCVPSRSELTVRAEYEAVIDRELPARVRCQLSTIHIILRSKA
jgi:hypothetical protein